MRIVNRKAFLSLPAGTVFAKCKPWSFESLGVKGDTILNDFYYTDLSPSAIDAEDSGQWSDMLDESLATGRELPMDFECLSRDGCFDDADLFAVFSRENVAAMIACIQRASEKGNVD